MCFQAVAAVAAVASAVSSFFGGQQQAKQAKKDSAAMQQANEKADANAKATLSLQQQDLNKRNAKQPNIAALLATNQNTSGQNSTLLAGPNGVAPSSLSLGKNTLLGQ